QWVAALALSLAVNATGEWAAAQSRSTSLYRGYPATQAAATEEMPSRLANPPANQGQAMPAKAQPSGDVGYMSNGYASAGCNSCGCMPGSCNQGIFDGGYGCSSDGCCSEECCDSQYGGCGSCGGCCVGNYLGLGNSS